MARDNSLVLYNYLVTIRLFLVYSRDDFVGQILRYSADLPFMGVPQSPPLQSLLPNETTPLQWPPNYRLRSRRQTSLASHTERHSLRSPSLS